MEFNHGNSDYNTPMDLPGTVFPMPVVSPSRRSAPTLLSGVPMPWAPRPRKPGEKNPKVRAAEADEWAPLIRERDRQRFEEEKAKQLRARELKRRIREGLLQQMEQREQTRGRVRQAKSAEFDRLIANQHQYKLMDEEARRRKCKRQSARLQEITDRHQEKIDRLKHERQVKLAQDFRILEIEQEKDDKERKKDADRRTRAKAVYLEMLKANEEFKVHRVRQREQLQQEEAAILEEYIRRDIAREQRRKDEVLARMRQVEGREDEARRIMLEEQRKLAEEQERNDRYRREREEARYKDELRRQELERNRWDAAYKRYDEQVRDKRARKQRERQYWVNIRDGLDRKAEREMHKEALKQVAARDRRKQYGRELLRQMEEDVSRRCNASSMSENERLINRKFLGGRGAGISAGEKATSPFSSAAKRMNLA